jgi:hypothetical protein
MRRRLVAALAALSMIGGSSAALAQSAAPLSLDPATRAAAKLEQPGDYRGGIIIPGLIILAIIGAIVLLTKGGDPASP